MPVDVISALDTQLVTLIGNGPESVPFFRVGNRLKQSTEVSWIVERSRLGRGADFPYLDILVGEDSTDSAFRKDESYAMRRDDFLETGEAWESDQNVSVRILIVSNKTDLSDVIAARSAVCNDIKRSGPRLHLPDLVTGYSGFTNGARFIFAGEVSPRGIAYPANGSIATIRFTVETTQDGYDSLGM